MGFRTWLGIDNPICRSVWCTSFDPFAFWRSRIHSKALAYAVDLPAEFGLGSNTAPVYSSFGVGYWIVWIGAIVSLTGRSWNLPFLQKLYSGLRHQGARESKSDSPRGTQ